MEGLYSFVIIYIPWHCESLFGFLPILVHTNRGYQWYESYLKWSNRKYDANAYMLLGHMCTNGKSVVT